MAQIASVAAITGTGKAFAVNEQGISRELKAGDVLQKGETIRTVGDVRVELVMDDGRLLAVAPNQVLRLDENVTESDQRPTAQDSAVGAPAATADTVLQALERGTDLSTELEATAAGLGGGGADGGSSFVQLLRIVEGVDPLAYNYTYTAPELPPDLQANPDVLTSTTMVLTADPVVLEGSPGVTYTVTLGDPAVSDMTVTLSNGAVIVIPAGSTTGSVLVPVQGDDVYKDGETLQASVDTVQGGGFLEITVTDQNVITVVNDTIDTTPVTVGVSVVNGDGDVNNVIEGNQLTFRFSVNAAPQSDLILNVTIGGVAQTVTIAAGSLFTDVTVASRADENYVQGATTVTGTVNSVSLTDNGNFENLSIESASATATIVDDGDVTTASISTSNVTENDAGVTFNISLSNVPQGTATAQVLVGETTYNVAIDANGKGTLFVATADPDPYKDPSSVTATVTGVTGGNYETVSVAGATATADITDIVGEGDTTTVSLATANVNEDAASVTFTATLSNPGETAVTIVTNLGNIVIAAGDTSGTLVINTQDSDVYLDASSLTATVSGVSGGNFEAVDFSEATATAQITDTINTTTVSLATANVNEDAASVTFTATLSNPGETAVTIVTNLGNIVIAAGDTSGTLVINTQDSDVYLDASSLTATVTGVTGGNFEAVDFSEATATAQITDTINTTTVSLATANVNEDAASVTFTATLSNPGETAVTIVTNLGNIVIAAGDTSGTLVINTQDSDVYLDASSLTATVSGVSGGNFEAVDFSEATATAQITDTINTTTVSLATANVNEDAASVTFTATLSNPGETAVTIVTNLGNIVIAAGDTSGTLVINTQDSDVYLDASSLTATVSGVSGGNFEAVDFSEATATAQITDTINTTTVSLATANVNEDAASVTFTATLSNPGETAVTIVTNLGNIVIAAGDTSGTLVINTQDSDVYLDASSLTATVSGVSGGNFEAVDFSEATATAQITDTINTTTVSLATANVNEDAASVTFTATLSNPGETAVTIVTNLGNIVIAAGDTSGTLVINTQDSDVYLDASSLTATVSGVSGGNFEAVDFSEATATAQITDTINTTTVSLATANVNEDAASVTFTATLSNPGETAVTIVTNLGNIVIAAGDTSGTLVINTQDSDVYLDASSLTATVSGVSGGNFEAVDFSEATATAQITDTIQDTTVSLAATASITEAGTVITYTATLTNPADAGSDVTVTLSNGETITILGGASSGFVNHTVTADEDVYLDPTTVSAKIDSATGGNFENLLVNSTPAVTSITDTIQDTTVTLGDVTVDEGASYTLSVTITSAPISGPLVLALSNGATATFTVGGPLTVNSTPVSAPNAVDGGSTLPVSITSHTGGAEFENLVLSDAGVVTIHDSTPTAGTVSATVDDEGLLGGIVGGTGDYSDTNADVDNNQATFGGTLTHNFGGDSTGASINFASMHGATGSVGMEIVTYGWDSGTNTLTATVTGGARNGTALFTVLVSPTTGAYKVTLLDNVLHANAQDENDAGPVALTYTVVDGDSSTATGTLNVTLDDDTPTFTQIMQGIAANQVGVLSGTHNIAFGADGEGSINLSGLTTVEGLNYSAAILNDDGSTTITAGTGTSTTGFFELTVKADGTYDFNLIDPRPSVPKTVTFGEVQGAAGVPVLTIGTGANAITFTGLGGDTIKPTSAGFGVNDGNLNPGDNFSIAFAGNEVDSVSFSIKHQGGGEFSMKWTTDTGETSTVSTSADAILKVDPSSDFSSITFETLSGNAKVDSFSYSQNLLPPDQVLQFDISATDADGDVSATQTLGIQLLGGAIGDPIAGTGVDESILGTSAGETIIGGAGHDIISGGLGNDIISGGLGNDTLTGGTGSLPDTTTDTFKWSLNDTGSDKITDFNLAPVVSGGDVLDLKDLLVGETNTVASLDTYLHFSADTTTGQTVITVDVNAGLAGGTGQTITLENVQFTALQTYAGGAGDDAAIIAKLLADGHLKTDI